MHHNCFLNLYVCLYINPFESLTPLYEAGMERQRNASPAQPAGYESFYEFGLNFLIRSDTIFKAPVVVSFSIL